MIIERILANLSVLAIGLLLVALGLSAAGTVLPGGIRSLDLAALDGIALTPAALASFGAGWTLRWLYSLPWSAAPRAFVDWLLGWRRSATMVGLAMGCTVVLLLY